jgi:hypothetical protein
VILGGGRRVQGLLRYPDRARKKLSIIALSQQWRLRPMLQVMPFAAKALSNPPNRTGSLELVHYDHIRT